jgi:hypothetical protein
MNGERLMVTRTERIGLQITCLLLILSGVIIASLLDIFLHPDLVVSVLGSGLLLYVTFVIKIQPDIFHGLYNSSTTFEAGILTLQIQRVTKYLFLFNVFLVIVKIISLTAFFQ